MSDEYGNAADEAGAGASGALEPALAGRLDTMHRTLSTLGMRIDALVTSTTTYRSALTDRLNEYAELVAKLTRAQAADLEEQRRTSDRAATELRQSLSGSEQALERVAARIEAMAGGTGDEEHEQLLAEIRSVHEAQRELTRSLTESLDGFGERTSGSIEAIRESLLDVASGEVVGALWDEFRGTRASLDEMRIAVERSEEAARSAAEVATRPADAADPTEQLEPLRADVSALTGAVRDLLEQAEVVDEAAEPADQGMLTAVAADVASLRNELARGLVVEPSDALTGAVDQLRADVAGLDARLAAIDEMQRAVAELRTTVAEVAAPAPAPVDDAEPDPTLTRVDDGVRDLSQGLADLDARLAALAERLATDDRLVGLEDRLAERIGGRLAGLEGLVGVEDRLDERIGGRLAGLEGLAGVEDRLDERIGGRLAGLEGLAGVEDRLDERIGGRLAGLEGLVGVEDRLDERIGGRLADLAGVEDRLDDRIGARLAGLGALDGIEDRLDQRVAERLASVDQAAVEERLGALDEQLDVVQQRLAEQLGAVEQRLGGMDRHLAGIDEVHRVVTELRSVVEQPAPEPVGDDDATAEELRSVRDRVIGLGERLDSIAGLQDAVTALRDEVRAAAAAEPTGAVLPEELEGELATLRNGVDTVDTELRTVRSGVEDIIARLDEGLVLADEIVPPQSAAPDEVSDQLAALRDQVSSGFDALRDLADAGSAGSADVDLAPVTELLEHLRDDLAELPARIAPAADGERFATLDPDVVDLLREEIRASRGVQGDELDRLRDEVRSSGGVPEEALDQLREEIRASAGVPEDVLEQVRKELVALRRRIKLRAEGEVLTEDQLEQIAAAVARRLGG